MYKSSRKEFFNNIICYNNNNVIMYNYIAAYWKPWHGQNSLFRQCQAYSGTFSNIQLCSAIPRYIKAYQTYSGITEAYGAIIRYIRNSAEEASSPLFENQKRCSDFGNKSLDCFNLWVRFSIQNVVLRVSRKKNPKCFPEGSLFLVFFICFLVFFVFLTCFGNVYQSALVSQTILPPSPTPYPQIFYYSFCKTLHLKCLTVFWTRVSAQ